MTKELKNEPPVDAAKVDADPSPAEHEVEEEFFKGPEQPAQDDDVDHELLALPRPRRKGRHPLVSLAVLLLSLYLIYFLRTDLLFFLQPRTPPNLGQVDVALAQGKLSPNTYVKLTGAPDRKHALLLEARFGGFESFIRLRQGGNKVFVQSHRERRATDKEISSSHQGQLVRFTDLPYHEALQANFKKTMSLAHDLDYAAIRASLKSGSGTIEVTDRKGEKARITPDSQLWINVAFPGEWVVQFSKRAYATTEQPIKALDHIGLPYAEDNEKSRMFHRFVVLARPDQTKALMDSFKDRSLHAGVIRRQLSYSALWEQLRVKGSDLIIDARDPTFPKRYKLQDGKAVVVEEKGVHVPGESVLYITTSSPFLVAPDALVLITDRVPGDNWHYALLGLLLLIFALTNGVILALRLKERRKKSAA